MKTILSILLVSLFCLYIFGCNKNTNYTTAAPYLKYELFGREWSTIVNYKLGRAMGVLGKIKKGLEERGYECSNDSFSSCLKRERLGRGIYRDKWIFMLFKREKPISDYGIVPIRFELATYDRKPGDTVLMIYTEPFDQPYLEMMKDLDETIVRIRD